MIKNILLSMKPAICLVVFFLVIGSHGATSQTICIGPESDQIMGVKDGFRYELWSQDSKGHACMTLGSGALFSGEWDGVFNYLARRGFGFDNTRRHQEIGRFYAIYNCIYKPTTESGMSYLAVYGWTLDPLTEYYIVEDWRNWIPSKSEDAIFKGTIIVNDGVYDIYQSTRVNKPSIVGIATFEQFFSIRREVRNSGKINISDHFDKWESLGMTMGKLYEVSFTVEGFRSRGSFEFTELDMFIKNNPETVANQE